jgi:hypothetical protein
MIMFVYIPHGNNYDKYYQNFPRTSKNRPTTHDGYYTSFVCNFVMFDVTLAIAHQSKD